MFGNLEMDMIALESAISVFEMENGLDADYFQRMSYVEPVASAATEGAYGDADDMFAGLFEDTNVLPATEGVGSKIANGISSIVGAIKRFFSNLGESIRNIGKKTKDTANKAKAADLTPAEQNIYDQAKDLRAAVKKGIGILNNSLIVDANTLETICSKIEKGLDQAKNGSFDYKDEYTGKNADKQKQNDVQKLTNVGKNIAGQFDGANDKEKYESARANVELGTEILDKIKGARKNIEDALEIIADKYEALVKRLNNLKTKAEGNSKISLVQKDKSDKSAEEITADVRKQYENAQASKGAGSTDFTATAANIRKILVKGYYVEDNDIVSNVVAALEKASNACSKQVSNCDKIIEKASHIQGENKYTTLAYNSCKLYKEASTQFSALVKYAKAFADGAIFNPKDERGNSRVALADNSLIDSKTTPKDMLKIGKDDDYEK